MDILRPAAFEEHIPLYDRLVWQTSGIDRYCSSSGWVLSAHEAFHGDHDPIFLTCNDGYGLFFQQQVFKWGRMLLPLESSWFLGCPLISDQPLKMIPNFRETLQSGALIWDACVVSGIAMGSPMFTAIVNHFSNDHQLRQGPGVVRHMGDLRGGLDDYLARRGKRFCKNIRRTCRLAESEGLTFQWWSKPLDRAEADDLFNRVMKVEAISWKGTTGVGINSGTMRAFYYKMIQRQAPNGIIRLGFAQQGGRDVGYILGGVMGSVYRGYQFSFEPVLSRISPGNWMQYQAIQRLCKENVLFYDLGSDLEYKRKWADITFDTTSLIIARKGIVPEI